MKEIIIICYVIGHIVLASAFNCKLPIGCQINDIHNQIDHLGEEKTSILIPGILCDIRDENFQFNYPMPTPLLNLKNLCLINVIYQDAIEIRFRNNFILGKRFNITNMLTYFKYFRYYMVMNFVNLNGFELDILNEGNESIREIKQKELVGFNCINCKMDFYSNGRLLKTCQDIIDSDPNEVMIRTLFQIQHYRLQIPKSTLSIFALINPRFKTTMCPLLFKNSNIKTLGIIGLVDTFFKKNTLAFENNRTFYGLNSTIKILHLKVENMKIDSNLLNPFVLEKLEAIFILGPINMIDGNSLNAIKSINIENEYFVDMIRKNGIDWIRDLNAHLNVNLSNISEIENTFNAKRIVIRLRPKNYITETSFSKLFRVEDFCLYKDFPFKQLVILLIEISLDKEIQQLASKRNYTCTYLWIAQYFHIFLSLNLNEILDFYYLTKNIKSVVMTKSYKSMSTCDFQYRLSLCNRSTYHRENWWGRFDYIILNKKLQSVFKIGQYLVALFGIVTNLLVVIIILHKKNKETFKDLNHYSYLWLNSVFNLLILIITLFSWINECFYPFEVFCPEIRKVIFIQYFKMIFKEVIVTLLKFMCNFTYVAFALNRIALIGKDHSKLIKYISELDIKVYTLVTFLISSSLSWIKFFKYQVNYFEPHLNYPISNEWDINKIAGFSNFKRDFITNKLFVLYIPFELYFIYNLVSDIINYVIFVITIISIDMIMLFRMKRTLEEKLKWYDQENNKLKYDEKKKENEDAVNKLIKMVVINTAIAILFKLPSSFLPIINLYASFYYQNNANLFIKPVFGELFSFLSDTGMSKLLVDIYDFLFVLSIAIQFFIYKRFDKKFQEGYNTLLFTNIKKS